MSPEERVSLLQLEELRKNLLKVLEPYENKTPEHGIRFHLQAVFACLQQVEKDIFIIERLDSGWETRAESFRDDLPF